MGMVPVAGGVVVGGFVLFCIGMAGLGLRAAIRRGHWGRGMGIGMNFCRGCGMRRQGRRGEGGCRAGLVLPLRLRAIGKGALSGLGRNRPVSGVLNGWSGLLLDARRLGIGVRALAVTGRTIGRGGQGRGSASGVVRALARRRCVLVLPVAGIMVVARMVA